MDSAIAGRARQCRRHAGTGLLLIIAISGASRAEPAARFPLAAGEYALRATLVMPHLEEMRRIVTQERRCIGEDAAESLFPVLRQPALRGCRLGHGHARQTAFDYLLVCESARVASGTASLRHEAAQVIGMLEVKMGGKNMTFSQRVEARRQGDCAAHE